MKKMTKIWIYSFALLGVLLMLSISCKKKDDTSNPTPVTVKDGDGNVYTTITIGTQVWLVENLKTTKYNDGSSIPLVTDNDEWKNLNTHGYCWYDNDAATYKNTYGAMYNWYAVSSGKLAPKGWHIPTVAEWTTLISYLGGESVAGGKMKETGTTHWMSPNAGATNSSGFTALGGGSRYGNGYCDGIRVSTYFWSSRQDVPTFYGLDSDYEHVWWGGCPKSDGYYVRCLKD